MEKALQIINQMHHEGIFEHYAIGGGIAALFYVEPFVTFDLDIFVILRDDAGPLVSLSPIYDWLLRRGYVPQKEYIVIEGIPVQFIPVYNDLVKDAVLDACEQKYGNRTTFALKKEYLLAIMLQTGRPKDRERLGRLWEEAKMSTELLDAILVKHGLKDAFDRFRRSFYVT